MRKLIAIGVALLALLAPAAASAHPLGNFTVNHFTRVEVSGDHLYLRYVIDMAEIPTFQARNEVAARGEEAYARDLASTLRDGLSLTVAGNAVTLRELGRELTFPDGAGSLETTRLELVLDAGELPASGSPLELTYADTNDPERIGWREIVLVATGGAAVASASVPDQSVSDELRAYPEDLLQSPLDVRQATARVTPGTLAGPPPALSAGGDLASPARVSESTENGFTELISRESLSIGVVVVSLLVAMFWGAVHALSPGHGKAIVAAYLIGTRGTPRHALYLGLIVTVTHTIGVFALGAITLGLSEFIVPDDLYPWMNLVSAILVVAVGVTVLRMRILDWFRGARRAVGGGAQGHSHDSHHHDHSHDHAHDHDRDHDHDAGTRPRRARALPLARARPRSPARPRAGNGLARPSRRRHLGWSASVPECAGRAARRDLAPPRRLRARPDRRFLPGPRGHDLRDRPRRDQGPRRLRPPQELSGTGRSRATGPQRGGDPRARHRNDGQSAAGCRLERTKSMSPTN